MKKINRYKFVLISLIQGLLLGACGGDSIPVGQQYCTPISEDYSDCFGFNKDEALSCSDDPRAIDGEDYRIIDVDEVECAIAEL